MLLLLIVSIITTAVFARDIAYYDLPTAHTTRAFVVGRESLFPFCWSGFNGARDPKALGAGLRLVKGSNLKFWAKKTVELSPKFEPMALALRNGDQLRNAEIEKFRLFFRDSYSGQPKCWLVRFTIPDNILTGDQYQLQITKKSMFGTGGYSKSPKISIVNMGTVGLEKDAPMGGLGPIFDDSALGEGERRSISAAELGEYSAIVKPANRDTQMTELPDK